MQKTFIFDFDGTIADSFELVVDIAYELLDIDPLSTQEIAHLRRLPLLKVARELHIPFTRIPRLIFKGRSLMTQRMGEVQPCAGMPQAIRALAELDCRLLLISSNGAHNVRTFLRAHGLEQYFESVHGGVGLFDKSGAVRKVLKRQHIDKNDCYYVGDEVRDAQAAKKAGVHAVSVTWGYQDAQALEDCKPFAVIHKPSQLVTIAKS